MLINLLSPAHTLLSSLQAAPLVATAFTAVFVPISASAAAVISSEVAAIVAGAAAADNLAATVLTSVAAAVVAASNSIAAAVISAAGNFSATVGSSATHDCTVEYPRRTTTEHLIIVSVQNPNFCFGDKISLPPNPSFY
jgi:hypothetical protein